MIWWILKNILLVFETFWSALSAIVFFYHFRVAVENAKIRFEYQLVFAAFDVYVIHCVRSVLVPIASRPLLVPDCCFLCDDAKVADYTRCNGNLLFCITSTRLQNKLQMKLVVWNLRYLFGSRIYNAVWGMFHGRGRQDWFLLSCSPQCNF